MVLQAGFREASVPVSDDKEGYCISSEQLQQQEGGCNQPQLQALLHALDPVRRDMYNTPRTSVQMQARLGG